MNNTKYLTNESDNSPIYYYNEDNIPIRTLYVTQQAKQFKVIKNVIDMNMMQKYFSRYGALESVKVKQTKVDDLLPQTKYALVTFKKAESAARVLQIEHHKVCKAFLQVTYANSWHQPNVCDNKLRNKEFSCQTNDQQSELLRILNDDCIIHILTYLDLEELDTIAKISLRFKNVLEIIHKKYKIFDFEEYLPGKKLTLMQMRDVLLKIGPNLTSLTISENKFCMPSSQHLEMILKYCPNLKNLKITGFQFSFQTMHMYAKYLENLHTIEILNFSLPPPLPIFVFDLIALQALNISSCSESSYKMLLKYRSIDIKESLFQTTFLSSIKDYGSDDNIAGLLEYSGLLGSNRFNYKRNTIDKVSDFRLNAASFLTSFEI